MAEGDLVARLITLSGQLAAAKQPIDKKRSKKPREIPTDADFETLLPVAANILEVCRQFVIGEELYDAMISGTHSLGPSLARSAKYLEEHVKRDPEREGNERLLNVASSLRELMKTWEVAFRAIDDERRARAEQEEADRRRQALEAAEEAAKAREDQEPEYEFEEDLDQEPEDADMEPMPEEEEEDESGKPRPTLASREHRTDTAPNSEYKLGANDRVSQFFTKDLVMNFMNGPDPDNTFHGVKLMNVPRDICPAIAYIERITDTDRINRRKGIDTVLKQVLEAESPENAGEFGLIRAIDTADLAMLIEAAIWERVVLNYRFERAKLEHREAVLSVISNLMNPKVDELRRAVLTGGTLPTDLTEMSPELLADDEMREVRRANREFHMGLANQKALAASLNSAAATDITCGRCGKKKVSYTQQQTRSADEPMTVTYTCNYCGNRWRGE
ncbi:Transcription factor S-II (TFIIS) [Carpediemonas membranifera]|uniref:Transcription factor S-II (TFIIS) n=1 Tax=Carpediemonas membranifera TaxID=201153 RepID=A0A8J6DXQ5_9EUKA|nr:Transcription factor S-II (TFIIS) [Carpediemonas membranifera]|eukprot:KAG9390789.1 Transcription factor S-II (TFIIS) [Carpediemonas membranifera]